MQQPPLDMIFCDNYSLCSLPTPQAVSIAASLRSHLGGPGKEPNCQLQEATFSISWVKSATLLGFRWMEILRANMSTSSVVVVRLRGRERTSQIA